MVRVIERLSIRTVLLAGFGVMLGLWLFAGYQVERVDRPRAEIREFRLASDEVLATDSSRWPAEARTLLRRFMPKRESAIRISDEVQARPSKYGRGRSLCGAVSCTDA